MNKNWAWMRGLRLTGAGGPMAMASSGPAGEVYAFDIPRGDLATVLIRIVLVSRSSIVFLADLARGHEAGPIRSYETVEDALMRALVGTNLEIGRVASGVLTVRRMPATPATAAGNGHEAAVSLTGTTILNPSPTAQADPVKSALDRPTEAHP